MRSGDVAKLVREELEMHGLPRHVIGIKVEPPKINIQVLIGGRPFKVSVRSTATKSEVEGKLVELLTRWELHRQGQRDIEDKGL